MAVANIITRRSIISKLNPTSFPHFSRLLLHSATASTPDISATIISKPPSHLFSVTRTFCTRNPRNPNPKLVNFSLPSDSESDSESTQQVNRPKLPPPYDPFSNNPALDHPDDPKNLQEVFAKIREDGLMNSAAKMFDGLSKEGLTHEALELFSQIKDKGEIPDVVAHTAVIEAYVNAGQGKEAHKVYLRMLASGVLPNAYTYCVVIRGLVETRDVKMIEDARKYVVEMVGRGMKPNASTCVGVFEALVGLGLEGEGREMLEMLKAKSVVPEESKVREVLKNKSEVVYRSVMSVLYGK